MIIDVPRKESATDHDEESVNETVKRFCDIGEKISGWGNPIGDTTDGYAVALDLLPIADEPDPPTAFESLKEYLREEIEIAD